jgi:deazaflavin-dependent oxidoreductase (nitroreductase family)
MSNSYRDFNRTLIDDLRANKGKVTSGPFAGGNLLILTTTGAKSGEDRENPLVYSRNNGQLVIVASKGGAPTNPAWYHNLVTEPTVTVEVGGKKFKARARIAEGEEYERLYGQHATLYPTFHEYRKRTSRKIPVVVLEPAA